MKVFPNMENTRGEGSRMMIGVGVMKLSASWRHGGLWLALMIPFGVFAAPASSAPDTVLARAEPEGVVQPIQLAAAIGIVKPESSEPAAPPVEPAIATPPAVESGPAVEEPAGDVAASTGSGGSRSRTILIGAGVAALLGALAGGGGGGSSTPQH